MASRLRQRMRAEAMKKARERGCVCEPRTEFERDDDGQNHLHMYHRPGCPGNDWPEGIVDQIAVTTPRPDGGRERRQGSPTFARSLKAMRVLKRLPTIGPMGIGMVAGAAVEKLVDSRAIVVGKAQAEVLPIPDAAEAWRYMERVRLPFPRVYIDMCDDQGNPTLYARDVIDPAVYGFTGLVMWEADATKGGEQFERRLQLVSVMSVRSEDAGLEVLAIKELEDTIPGALAWFGPPHLAREGVGYVTIQLDPKASQETKILDASSAGKANAMFASPAWYLQQPGLQGAMILPTSHEQTEGKEAESVVKGSLAIARASVMVAASVMMFLDSRNVETVEGHGIPKRDLRRAEKRGWQIAHTVKVSHTTRKRRQPRTPTGNERQFSHRFEVIGHYNHVTRGPHVKCDRCQGTGEVEPAYADGDGEPNIEQPCLRCLGTGVDPAKVTPCALKDDHDYCRREWVPLHVVGPEDKPLIPKVRRVNP